MRLLLWIVLSVLFFFTYIPFGVNAVAIPNDQVSIYINLWTRQLLLIRNLEIVKRYPIAPGSPETPTPVGDFIVVEKSAFWGKGFGARWLGLNVPFGNYDIHGTNKPHLVERYVSHGCVRMRNKDIEELFPFVKPGTPVRIDGPILGREGLDYRILVRGSRGSLVQMVQNRLNAGGYYKGDCHGIYTWETEKAVKEYQKENGLPVTGQIQFADLVELGVVE